jgi:hypothetical protein
MSLEHWWNDTDRGKLKYCERYLSMEHWWNDTDRGNRSTGRDTCPSATLSITDSTWTGLGANPGLGGEKPATNRLSHGTALNRIILKDITVACVSRAATVLKTGPDSCHILSRSSFTAIVS